MYFNPVLKELPTTLARVWENVRKLRDVSSLSFLES